MRALRAGHRAVSQPIGVAVTAIGLLGGCMSEKSATSHAYKPRNGDEQVFEAENVNGCKEGKGKMAFVNKMARHAPAASAATHAAATARSAGRFGLERPAATDFLIHHGRAVHLLHGLGCLLERLELEKRIALRGNEQASRREQPNQKRAAQN
jgi:hypothetical protein